MSMREWAVLGVKLIGVYLAANAIAEMLHTVISVVQYDPLRTEGPRIFGFFMPTLGYLVPAFVLTRHTDFCLRLACFPEPEDEDAAAPKP